MANLRYPAFQTKSLLVLKQSHWYQPTQGLVSTHLRLIWLIGHHIPTDEGSFTMVRPSFFWRPKLNRAPDIRSAGNATPQVKISGSHWWITRIPQLDFLCGWYIVLCNRYVQKKHIYMYIYVYIYICIYIYIKICVYIYIYSTVTHRWSHRRRHCYIFWDIVTKTALLLFVAKASRRTGIRAWFKRKPCS